MNPCQGILKALGVRDLRKQIETKTFERTVIANLQVPPTNLNTYNTFKDPYFLDFLGFLKFPQK